MEFVKDSNNIRVFPASLRMYNGMGKYTTENNLTGIPRSVHDYASYLLSRTKGDSPFRFVIHGYYFEIDNMGFAATEVDTPEANRADANMYIHILVENTNEYSRLVDYEDGGTDLDNAEGDNFNFRGLAVDSDEDPEYGDTSHTIYTLKLTDNDGYLAKESFIRDLPDSIGDRDGESVGCFEVVDDGSLGFSQPIYLEAIGGFKPVNTIFWDKKENNITDGKTVNGKRQPADVGDIFFGI